MKFADMKPIPDDIHLTDKLKPCEVCGELTRTIDIDYIMWVCSEECRKKFEKNL